jgi:hypothetical protein
MSKHCDCGGNMKEYNPKIRVCQKCKKIPELDTLLEILQEMGAKEETLKSLKKDMNFSPV